MRLPRQVGKAPQPASLVCPDCGGALPVRAEGDADYLLFVCQVGHSFSAAALVAEKERRLEEVLWSGVYRLEELAGLLTDLDARGSPGGGQPQWPAARRRIERLHDQAKRLRHVLDDNEPIDLDAGAMSGQDTA